ncbi:unnamed protein product, partial [Scytosiphon promiscuus]
MSPENPYTKSKRSPPPGPLLLHPHRRQAAREGREREGGRGDAQTTSSAAEDDTKVRASRSAVKLNVRLDRSQLPLSPTLKTRQVGKEAVESRQGGWVPVVSPSRGGGGEGGGSAAAAAAAAAAASAAAASAAATAAAAVADADAAVADADAAADNADAAADDADSGARDATSDTEHARKAGSDFDWSKVGSFPFGQGDEPPTSSKPMSPLIQPRPLVFSGS